MYFRLINRLDDKKGTRERPLFVLTKACNLRNPDKPAFTLTVPAYKHRVCALGINPSDMGNLNEIANGVLLLGPLYGHHCPLCPRIGKTTSGAKCSCATRRPQSA